MNVHQTSNGIIHFLCLASVQLLIAIEHVKILAKRWAGYLVTKKFNIFFLRNHNNC